jgi:LacI family transcriptional regulator
MNDVARIAGVGTVTVSRVLNGATNVSEETAARVYRAINKLGYRPNEMARALRGLKSRTIGVIVPYLYDPFFATCAHSVNVVAREHKYSVILATSNESAETEHEEAQLMLQRHVEGLVVIPVNASHSRLSRSDFEKTHIVMLDRSVQDPRFDSVVVQNQSGTKRAIEHLIEVHGHKRIVFLGLERHVYTINARFNGYRRAMQAAGLTAEPFFDCTTTEAAREIVASLLREKNPPTAFFGSNNLTTRFLLQALLELGVRVPDQVALVGFDDFELAEVLQPTLTVVRQPSQELGRVAASILFDRLKRDELPLVGNRVMLPVELIVRRSCGCKPKPNRFSA